MRMLYKHLFFSYGSRRFSWGTTLIITILSKHITCILNQCTTKAIMRLVRPAKIQISLCIRAVRPESSLVACFVYSLQAIQSWINENHCHTEWMYRLIWVFVGHTVDICIYFFFILFKVNQGWFNFSDLVALHSFVRIDFCHIFLSRFYKLIVLYQSTYVQNNSYHKM